MINRKVSTMPLAGYNQFRNGELIMGIFDRLFGSALVEIKPVELNEKLKSAVRPFVLDVRQPEEFRAGHIAGAKLISLNELKSKMSELPKNREIICVCASGSRSSTAYRMLAPAGFKVINMHGGMSAWQRQNLPIKKGTAS